MAPHPDSLPGEREARNLKQNKMFRSKGINFETARNSPKKPTVAEAILWESLRTRKLLGPKFRRPCPISSYVIDFFCHGLNPAIEVDGKYHLDEPQIQDDIKRAIHLNSLGIPVFRLNNEGASDAINAIEKIKAFIESNIKIPSPKREG
jgi:very-short-patch-repair endonuclease